MPSYDESSSVGPLDRYSASRRSRPGPHGSRLVSCGRIAIAGLFAFWVAVQPSSLYAQERILPEAAGEAIESFIADRFGSIAVKVDPEVHGTAPVQIWSVGEYLAIHARLGLPQPEGLPRIAIIKTCRQGCNTPASAQIKVSLRQQFRDRARVTAGISFSPGQIGGTAPDRPITVTLVMELVRDSQGNWVVESVDAQQEENNMIGPQL